MIALSKEVPAQGAAICMPSGRRARFVGTLTDPFDGRALFAIKFEDGGDALFSRAGLARVLGASARHGGQK